MNIPDTRDRVLQFQSTQEAELRLVMKEVEKFAPEILGMQGFGIYDDISKVKRAGWERAEVGIPSIYVESVLEHSMNVRNASNAIILGTPEIIDRPEEFPIMGQVHDMPEGHRILPDITPHCNYTKEQKEILEKYAILYIEHILGEEGKMETRLLREYVAQNTKDSQMMFYVDKIDAGIKALDYEKIGFKKQVSGFHTYNIEKLSTSPYFLDIYQIMLEREFSDIPAHFQYFMLLELAGNYDEWRYRINQVRN